jgi:hypothetical protein
MQLGDVVFALNHMAKANGYQIKLRYDDRGAREFHLSYSNGQLLAIETDIAAIEQDLVDFSFQLETFAASRAVFERYIGRPLPEPNHDCLPAPMTAEEVQ